MSHGVGAGFFERHGGLANATTNCFPMIQISGSSERAIVDLQRGDYEELDQYNAAKPYAKAAYRVDRAADIGPAWLGRSVRRCRDAPAASISTCRPGCWVKRWRQAGARPPHLGTDPAPRQLPAPEALERALALSRKAKRPLIVLGKARRTPKPITKSGLSLSYRHAFPSHVDGEGAFARRPPAIGSRCTFPGPGPR